MEIWQAIVLGAVQGITEFLPVSSSGHLMLLQHWFGMEDALFYSVMLHLGTLIPVFIVLWKNIIELFKKPFNKLLYLVIASVPAGVIGLLFAKFLNLDELFASNIWLLGIAFIFTAVELFVAERISKRKQATNPINAKTALYMGLGQAVGVFSGVSRSGSTIVAGTLAGVNNEEKARFTFLMSIPIIIAAILLEGFDCVVLGGVQDVAVVPLLLGVLSATITGYIAVKLMLIVIKKANYKWFSLYLVLLGVTTVITYFI